MPGKPVPEAGNAAGLALVTTWQAPWPRTYPPASARSGAFSRRGRSWGCLLHANLLLSWIFWRLPQAPARTWRKTGHRAAARVRLALIPRLSLSGEGLVAGVAPHGVCIHSPHPLSTCCSDNCRSVCEQARFGEEPLGRWISLWITLWIGEGRVVDYCRCLAAGDGPLRVFMMFK